MEVEMVKENVKFVMEREILDVGSVMGQDL